MKKSSGKKECVSIKDLAVSGRDLIQAGMKPGERDRRDPKQISGRSFWKILKKIQKNICCPAFETLLTPGPPAYNERDMKKGGRTMCNDRGLSVLEQYGLEAGGRIPGAGGALICETQEGLVLIREYWGTARKLGAPGEAFREDLAGPLP